MRHARRYTPPAEASFLVVHGVQQHLFGRAIDESTGGLGIRISEPVELPVGDQVLVHRFHENRLRLAEVRHTRICAERGTRLGIRWCDWEPVGGI